MTTIWTGMNLFSLDQNTVVVDKRQISLIKTLDHKVNSYPEESNQYLMKELFIAVLLIQLGKELLKVIFNFLNE